MRNFSVKRIGLWAAGALALGSAAGAHAAGLAVFPPAIALESARDPQRATAVFTKDDGVTLDVTAQAEVRIEPPAIARWEGGRFVPQADGDGQVTMTYNGASVTLALHVANAAVDPPMSFYNDLEPALMKAGCNTGACHGSARGKNGFHLTLFGYDPDTDFNSLTREVLSRRINVAIPAQSLMLLKPTGAVDHEGGARFTADSELYLRICRWITEGARLDPGVPQPKLTGIEIIPPEAVLEGEGATQQFIVRASYADGTDRDVTDFAILSSVDDSIVGVNGDGLAKSGRRGEAYLMARYGTFAVVSQVISIPAAEPMRNPPLAAANYIDEMVYAKHKKLRISAAAPAADDVFVRRAYLDIAGVLPTVAESQAFIADARADKRAALVDQLLQRPEFSDLWAMKWAELLRVKSSLTLDRKGMHRYNDWLRQSIRENKPINQLAAELLTATGGNFTEPAANFYLVESAPTTMAENVAQVFMGVQIKCAQCHNHPFERWTMDDYYSFAAFFAQVGRKTSSDPREVVVYNGGGGEVSNQRNGQVMAPKFLGGATPDLAGRDRRAVLAEWLASDQNPWFAKNVANRVWQHFFGRGIIDPVDDVRVSNAPSNPQLLEELGHRLVAYNYDMRKLIRDICTSNTYQMSSTPSPEAQSDQRNFAYAKVRRLPSEMLLDAVCQVTGGKVKFSSLPIGARAVQVADGASGNYFLEVFGRPVRDTACACERRSEPTLAQALHLINGDTMTSAIRTPAGRLDAAVQANAPTEAALTELYTAAFARQPSGEEMTQLSAYVNGAPDRKAALEDVYWSVLNSKEFVFNH
jgi:hypothetical protein